MTVVAGNIWSGLTHKATTLPRLSYSSRAAAKDFMGHTDESYIRSGTTCADIFLPECMSQMQLAGKLFLWLSKISISILFKFDNHNITESN